jgi:rubrerythrin
MNTDLARAEAIAAALPRDYLADMHSGSYVRNVCTDCGHVFTGRVYRTVCAVCAPKAKQ